MAYSRPIDFGISWTLRLYGWFNCQDCRRSWQVARVKATRVSKVICEQDGYTLRHDSGEPSRVARRDSPAASDTQGARRDSPAASDTQGAGRDSPAASDTQGARRDFPAASDTQGARRDSPAASDTQGARRDSPVMADTRDASQDTRARHGESRRGQPSWNQKRKPNRGNQRHVAVEGAEGAGSLDYNDYKGPDATEYDIDCAQRQEPGSRLAASHAAVTRQDNNRHRQRPEKTGNQSYRWVRFYIKTGDENKFYKFKVMIEGRHACKKCNVFYFPSRVEMLKCSECGLSVGCMCLRLDGRKNRNNDPFRQHQKDLCENCIKGIPCTYSQ